jgi:hypothetical protein
MTAIIEWTSTTTGLNVPTQQVFAFPVGGDMANWLTLRQPMIEGSGANAGRYQATVDDSVYKVWYVYQSSSAPAYSSWIAVATIPLIAGSTAVSIPVTTPSVVNLVTGYWTCLSPLGVVEPGVIVSLKVADFTKTMAGIAMDETIRTATSDSNGVAQFTNLVPGVTYEAWRGSSTKRFQVKVPLGATGSLPLGNIIGVD